MFWFCWHRLDENIKDGYQYCKKCGLAIPVPCNHVWKVQDSYEIERNSTILGLRTVGEFHILQCVKCGEIQSRELTL